MRESRRFGVEAGNILTAEAQKTHRSSFMTTACHTHTHTPELTKLLETNSVT